MEQWEIRNVLKRIQIFIRFKSSSCKLKAEDFTSKKKLSGKKKFTMLNADYQNYRLAQYNYTLSNKSFSP